jgi:hypothetical protein
MGITNSQKVSSNSKWNFLTLIDKCYPLTRSYVYRTVNAVHHIQWPNLWINKDLGVLAAYYSQIFVLNSLLYVYHVAKALQTDKFCIN